MKKHVLFSTLMFLCTAIFGKTIKDDDPVNWNIGDTIKFVYDEYDDYNCGWEAVQLNNPYIICAFVGTNAQGFPFEGRIAIDATGTFIKYKGQPPIEFGDPVPDGKYVYMRKKTFLLQNGFKEVLAILVLVQ